MLVKKRKGPARLSALYFHFIPSFTPVFSRPSKNNMPPFTDNIMSGYVDTWEEGWKRLDGGKEVNNVTDVQDFHCEISPFLQCLPMKQNSVAEGLRRATEFSYRTFFPLFRSANFRCQNGLRLNEVWSSRERKREDFEFLNNSRWRCFGMSTILKFFETCNEMLSC